AILSMPEYNRFTKGIFGWIGFKTKWLEYENAERVAGETKWSFWKLFMYSLEGIIGFSTMPLMVASWLGVFMCLASIIAILFVVVRQLMFGGSAFGWPSMVCIILLLGGIQLVCIGILGQYLAKTYLESKNRPIYIAKERK
ncbi:MAG: glycosyltransferase, partial [Alistipes sp.]|nr:glycosyltransferase [Alistipes sp.]